GRGDGGAVLGRREYGAVGQRRALSDVPQAVAGADPDDAAGPVRVRVGVWAVDGIAVERVAEERRVARSVGGVQAPRGLVMMVAAHGRRMTEAGIEVAGFHDDRILVPDVLVVVGMGVERIVDGNAVRPGSDRPERR